MDLDVAVIGAGPSGLIAARELAQRNVNVRVFEEHLEIGVPTHCAGLLSLRGLRELDIETDQSFTENYVRGAKFYSPSGMCFEVKRSEPLACVVNREGFDKYLANLAVRAGADIVRDRPVERLRLKEGKVVLHTKGECIKAAFAIDAEGARSSFVRAVGLQTIDSDMVLSALQYDLIDVKIDKDYVEIHLNKRLAPTFFCWVIPTGPKKARVGLAGKRVNVQQGLDTFVKGRFESYSIQSVRGGLVVTSGPIPKTYIERLAIVGDAAGQVKPTTGGGVIFGGICSRICGRVIANLLSDAADADSLEAYDALWRERLGPEVRKMMSVRRWYNRLPGGVIDRLFKIIIDMGLHTELSEIGDIDYQSAAITMLLDKLPRAFIKYVSGALKKRVFIR